MIAHGIRRFYKSVEVTGENGAYAVKLDGKPVKTPRRAALSVPTDRLAEAIAEEWRAQGDTLDASTMPLTQLVFAAIDTVANHRARICEEIVAYGRTDLLCYRAEAPASLVERQASAWDPLLAWLEEELGANLATGRGIAFVVQEQESLDRLAVVIGAHDNFGLAALHGATAITGSLVLALALERGRLDASEAFLLSRLDEAYQIEAWGVDIEAEARARRLESELSAIERFLRLARP